MKEVLAVARPCGLCPSLELADKVGVGGLEGEFRR